MTIENDGLALRSRDIEGLVLPTLEFTTDEARLLCVLIHRLPDAVSQEAEGAAIVVSSRRR